MGSSSSELGAVFRRTLFFGELFYEGGCSCAWPASPLIAFADGEPPGCSCVRPASLLIACADREPPGCSCVRPASLLIAFAEGFFPDAESDYAYRSVSPGYGV